VFNAVSLKQDKVGRTVTAGHTGSVTRANLVPVMAGFRAAGSTCIVNRTMFAVCAYSRKREMKTSQIRRTDTTLKMWV